jgi:sugar phosphate isomerase/epimerase
VDEIELIFFEGSSSGSLPTPEEISELAGIAGASGIRYNVHLPLDISPGSPDRRLRSEAIKVILWMFTHAAVLDPTTWTLHLPFDGRGRSVTDIKAWQLRIREALARILDSGVAPGAISIENLDYPFGWVEKIVAEMGLAVCLDVGHLILQGEDPGRFYARHAERLSICHLHGVRDGRDHLPLTALPDEETAAVLRILKSFTGTVSLEVFTPGDLAACLEWLEKRLPTWPESA